MEALITLDGKVYAGDLPRRALSLVREWLALEKKPLRSIDSLGVMTMILHTAEVTPLPGYRLMLTFNTGESGEVDLSGELEGEVFEPLRNPALFATAHQHPIMRTVAWANGADLAPEFLLELMRGKVKQAA